MLVPVSLLPGAVSELFAQAIESGRITLNDRYGLMAAILEDSLEVEERQAIDRLLRSVCRRKIAVER